jgi:hypothetical protein
VPHGRTVQREEGDIGVLRVLAARDAAHPGVRDVRAGDAVLAGCRIASSSLPVIIHPQVNSSVFLGDDSVSGCFTSSWPGAGPVDPDQDLPPGRAFTCLSALSSTSL